MKKNTTLLASICCIALSATAQDTVLLKNGDILSGEILKETDEHVYFRSSAFGAVSLQTKDIEEVRFQTEEHGEVVSYPETAETTDQTSEVAKPSEAAAPGPPPQPKPEKAESKWSGQAGLAIAMRESTKHNATGTAGTDKYETYRFYGNMGWKSRKNKLKWDWTYRYSRDEYEKQDDYLNITQHYTHDFRESYYATAKTMYQQDYRRRIEHEYLQTAEMGVKWISLPDFELSTSAGGGYHKYNRDTNNSNTSPDEEITIFFDESMRWKIINSLTLIQKYTHLGDLTDYHFVFTAGLENKLIHDVFLRMEYRLDRDTGVSDNENGYNDKALLASLLYKF